MGYDSALTLSGEHVESLFFRQIRLVSGASWKHRKAICEEDTSEEDTISSLPGSH